MPVPASRGRGGRRGLRRGGRENLRSLRRGEDPGHERGSFVPADETGDLTVGGDGSSGISATTDRTSYAKSSVIRADAAILLRLLLLFPHFHRHAVDFHVVLDRYHKAAAAADELRFYKI